MEDEKNNRIIIVPILVAIVFLVIGWFIGSTFANKESKNKDNTSVVEKDNNNEDYNKEQKDNDVAPIIEKGKVDLVSAKKLIDKYFSKSSCSYNLASVNGNLFTEGMTPKMKKLVLTLNISEKHTKKLKCEDIKNVTIESDGNCYGWDDYGETSGFYISYNDLNNIYKKLFGKNENLEKETINLSCEIWKYDTTHNIFIRYYVGCDCHFDNYYNGFVKTVEENDDELKIKVGYVELNATDDFEYDGDTFVDYYLSTTIKGEKVIYKSGDIEKETFEEEFKNKYLDKLDTYEFTFKYEDDHYVFVDLKKID